MSDLMTAAEAAQYLRVTYLTICRLAREGKIPASKVGGGWRFRKEVLDELLPQKGSVTPVAHILVVDDDPRYREVLEDVISGEGFPVAAVGTGEEALQEMRRHRFALIFLDLVLPGMSGVETLRTIKAENPEVLVAIVTGYGDDPIALEAMSMSPLVLIRKPFRVQDIRKVLSFVAGGQPTRQNFSADESRGAVKTHGTL